MQDEVEGYSGFQCRYAFDDIATADELALSVIAKARQLARGEQPILATGETGVGKERFAHAIHTASAVVQGPLVAINCAAVPQELVAISRLGRRGVAPGAFYRKHIPSGQPTADIHQSTVGRHQPRQAMR